MMMVVHVLLILISSCDCSQPKDGEPVVTVLSAGPIKVKDSHFSRPRGSSDLLRAPSRFPVPQSRVVLREISVVWHLYGGKDFGSKPMSTHTQHANRYDRQAISRLPEVVSLSSHSRGSSLFSLLRGRPAPAGARGSPSRFATSSRPQNSWRWAGGSGRQHTLLMEIQLTKVFKRCMSVHMQFFFFYLLQFSLSAIETEAIRYRSKIYLVEHVQ